MANNDSNIKPTNLINDSDIKPTNLIQVWGWNSTEAIGWDNSTIISISEYIPPTSSINPT